MTVAILGCGYTGRRLVDRLAARGVEVIATSRRERPGTVRLDITEPFDLGFLPPRSRVVVSIPVTDLEATSRLVGKLGERDVARLIYLSTTGVYGNAREVDHTTPVQYHDRVPVEREYLSGPWPALVLRPAAIYGPGRGVHERMARGSYVLPGDGSNYISRIHVDDLAAIVEAAVFDTLTGAFPVADERPCTSREMADYCSQLLGLPRVPDGDAAISNRRVDGSEIRRRLGVQLRYPSYKEGVRAAVDLRSNSGF